MRMRWLVLLHMDTHCAPPLQNAFRIRSMQVARPYLEPSRLAEDAQSRCEGKPP